MGVARSKLASTSRCATHSLPSPSLARQRGKRTRARVRMILHTADWVALATTRTGHRSIAGCRAQPARCSTSPSSRTTSAAHRVRRTNTLASAPHLLHHKLRRAVDRDGRCLAAAIVRDLHIAPSKHGLSYQRQVILALGAAHQRNELTSISRLLPLIVSTAPSFASPLVASMNVCKLCTKDSEQQERQKYWLSTRPCRSRSYRLPVPC